MTERSIIEGRAAALPIANLDTDQIMPKQFLRGIDKSGLAQGLLYDLRMDGNGKPRADFVLNRPAYCHANVLIAGPNFGCGSSREHAVWGMQQYGFKAVIASSYGEIFYSNAMNNRLMLVTLPEEQVQTLMRAVESEAVPLSVKIDVERLTLETVAGTFGFQLAERYRRMYLDDLDLIGMSLTHDRAVQSFAEAHWARQPWLKDVAQRTCERLAREAAASTSAG